MENIYRRLLENYREYQESSISGRLFKHQKIKPLIVRLGNSKGFEVEELGKSVEGREIYVVRWGRGKTGVLLWSQMHGDEPTATMAFLDLFHFLQSQDDFDDIRKSLRENLTLHFIPMLNPDGVERFQRRNAVEIDLNRDALQLQCPESRILHDYRARIQADWGFNMHDQRKYYTVGHSYETATISFLAPSYNAHRDINPVREDAMKVIIAMHEMLREFIPGKIARYTDKFYPRSFGDRFQRLGTRSILVESGGMHGDPEKQYIRKLHLMLLTAGLHSIATGSYRKKPRIQYETIPENTELLHDLIIRNATLNRGKLSIRVDLAFKTEEIAHEEHWDFYHNSSLIDMGDLSTFKGFEELDATGYTITQGRVYFETFYTADSIPRERFQEILQSGYTEVRLSKLPDNAPLLGLPVRLIPSHENPDYTLRVGKNPSLFLEKDGKREYAVVNGFLKKVN